MIERKAYICEHCNTYRPSKKKAYLSKAKAERHERACYYNQDLKTCWTCLKNDYYNGINHCEHGRGKSTLEQLDLPPSIRLVVNCEYWNNFDSECEAQG